MPCAHGPFLGQTLTCACAFLPNGPPPHQAQMPAPQLLQVSAKQLVKSAQAWLHPGAGLPRRGTTRGGHILSHTAGVAGPTVRLARGPPTPTRAHHLSVRIVSMTMLRWEVTTACIAVARSRLSRRRFSSKAAWKGGGEGGEGRGAVHE